MRLLTADEIDRQLTDLPGWSHHPEADGGPGSLRRTLQAPTFPEAVAIIADVADVAEEMDHHPDVDLRWRTLHFVLSTHSAGGVTQLDVELAHRISAIAADHGVRTDDALDARPRVEIAVPAADPVALLRWWAVALRYVEHDGDQLVDPTGAGPAVWFPAAADTPGGGLRLDLYLPRREVAARRDLLVARGGRVVDEQESWVTVADPEGHEVRLCWED